jgi:hypothetical protein
MVTVANSLMKINSFFCEELLASRITPQVKDHRLSVVRYCFLNIFAATFHIWRLPHTSAARERDVMVTVDPFKVDTGRKIRRKDLARKNKT